MDTRNLRLFIIEAKDLIAADNGTSSDPYAILKFNGDKFKTEVVKKSLAPQWNYTVDLVVNEYSSFQIEVFDWDRIGAHDKLGFVNFDLATLRNSSLSGQNDMWLALDKKGFVRVSFQFTPPFQTTIAAPGAPVQQMTIGQQPPPPQMSFVQQPPPTMMTSAGLLPPPVYYDPIYLQTIPTALKAEFLLPGEMYQKKYYVTGEPVNASLVLYVHQPIVVRSLFVGLKGKISFRGKKHRELIQDHRNLLQTTGLANTKVSLGVGKHIYPFEFFIPKNCNSSIEISNYVVQYKFVFNADIVNSPDIEITKVINVVNIEDTIHRVTKKPIQERTSKSPLTGGSIELCIQAPKDSYFPGEDIELTCTVTNNSKKKIKKLDLELLRTDTLDGDKSLPYQIVKTNKNFYPKVKQNQTTTQVMVVETPANMVNTLYQSGLIKIEYKIRAVLDLPNCVDLALNVPINIVLADPKREIPPSPLNELAAIPRYIKDWSARNFQSWLLFRMNCPEVITNNPEFYLYCLAGSELLSINDQILVEKVLRGAGARLEEIHKSIRNEIDKILVLRVMLKDNQLSSYIEHFEDHSITVDLLNDISTMDLMKITEIIGDRIRLEKMLKAWRSQQQQ
ncbi:hypothetical protein DICPUDRAFT_152151 [Dictyostelium purpureum]|uniref:C2 domain-containing protein n=1 Tax=Dictyostelium purpureum TaxID=5786 RepID=F0ZKL2_DICPU|nr:uncharacterized protein DICPUDRAFT_152151 [Dictyostelium purpureum]EGC35532.1 hypothetical protein DICPUDRAFT_152151 [Dictyostelium purpureum]|eukprot:XP_003287958.1 hypothetical protein DICPUDRAFT_152151 [Dictyostelium purpureum]